MSSSTSSQKHQQNSQSHTPHHKHEKTSITVEHEQSGEHESAQSTPEHQTSNILDYFKPVTENEKTDTSVETETKDKENKNKMADTDTQQQQHQIGLQDDTQSQGQGGNQGQDVDLEKKIGEQRQENVGEGPEATDEELDKVEARICEIVEGALKGIKPWLTMMVERCDEAEQKKKNSEDFNEKEFVEAMKPIIKQASEILEGALAEINTLDPEKKCQRRAQRNAEDNQASPKQRKIADGLQELTTSVQKAIEDCKKKIACMPTAKSELDKMFGMLSEPLFQILSAVGLLVYGVLNLLGQILDAIGLGGALRGILDGLGLSKLINALGWKLQIVQNKK